MGCLQSLEAHKINFNYIDNNTISISINETVGLKEINAILNTFTEAFKLAKTTVTEFLNLDTIPDLAKRNTPFLENEIYNSRIVPLTHEKIIQKSKFLNPFNHPVVMFRKSSVVEAGNYIDLIGFEDYFLWVRLLLSQKKLANLPCVVVDTTADDSYFDRRTGRDYQKSERGFACRLLELKFHTNLEHIVFRISRAPVRWMSTQFARKFYGYILRQSQK